ncbi:hypothetical protein [Halobellus marinus]|uniref:hypothetical protein n=1 Tax=Halobellus TaxID=1073986 RepID=UPI0028A68B0A|nr:hypothetical protein [Halobellus sp. DFY28]
MGTERIEELPDELESWVAERAAAEGIPRDEYVRRLLAAHREVERAEESPNRTDGSGSFPGDVPPLSVPEEGNPAPTDGSAADRSDSELESLSTEFEELADRLDAVEADLDERIEEIEDRLDDVTRETDQDTASASAVEALADEVEELTARVSRLEEDLDAKIKDVRERVIQVKRETDTKAPADHGHPDMEQKLQSGFENYERILEHLTDQTDEHDAKLDAIAGAIVDLRKRAVALERNSAERAAVSDLHREANQLGVTTAVCDSCGESVSVGLLDEPYCPHCESSFDGVESKSGFFGSHRLTVGDRPALEAGDSDVDPATDGSPADLGGPFDTEGEGADSGVESSQNAHPSDDSDETRHGSEEGSEE